jgi:putative transposase
MCRVFKIEVLESQEELEILLKQEKEVRKRERLQFLYWYKTGQAITRKGLGKLLNRSSFAIGQWIDLYRSKGLQGLLHLNYRGGNLAPSIPLEIQWQLKEKLAQPEGMTSYKAIQVWLKETHGLDVPYSTVFGTVKYRLNAGLKVPRPYAEDYDQEAVDDFKKNVSICLDEILTPCLKRYSSIRYWTQDESRFGLKTITRRRITLKKVKPVVKVQWQFKAFYLYGIVEPLTGELIIKNYDRVNTDNFQQFLNDFSQKYPKDFHVIQTDNARFHCANDLVMPDNVMLLYQPPHSPQVNSSEQLWQWSKGETANKLFANLDHLKATLNDLFQSKSKEFFASLTSRKFILNALQKIGMMPIT